MPYAPLELNKSNSQMRLAGQFLNDIDKHQEGQAADYCKWSAHAIWLNTLAQFRFDPNWDEMVLEYVIHNYFANKLIRSSILDAKGSLIFNLFNVKFGEHTIEELLEKRRRSIDANTLPVLIEYMCSEQFYQAILKGDALAFAFWTRWIAWLHIIAKESGFDLYDGQYDLLALQITPSTMYRTVCHPERQNEPFSSSEDSNLSNLKALTAFFYQERNCLVAKIAANMRSIHCRSGQAPAIAVALYKIRSTCTHDELAESFQWLKTLYDKNKTDNLNSLCGDLEEISSEEFQAYFEQDRGPLGTGFVCDNPEGVAFRIKAFLEISNSKKAFILQQESEPRRLNELFLGLINFITVKKDRFTNNQQLFILWNIATLSYYSPEFSEKMTLQTQLIASDLVLKNQPLFKLLETICKGWLPSKPLVPSRHSPLAAARPDALGLSFSVGVYDYPREHTDASERRKSPIYGSPRSNRSSGEYAEVNESTEVNSLSPRSSSLVGVYDYARVDTSASKRPISPIYDDPDQIAQGAKQPRIILALDPSVPYAIVNKKREFFVKQRSSMTSEPRGFMPLPMFGQQAASSVVAPPKTLPKPRVVRDAEGKFKLVKEPSF